MMADHELIPLSHLDTMLARATRIDEITEVRARAEAMRTYAVHIKASRETCQEYATARIRAERKAGQVLASFDLRGNNQHKRKSTVSIPSLKDCGITPDESHRWQTIAKLPDDEFERNMLERFQSGDDITTTFFYKAARIHIGRTNAPYHHTPQSLATLVRRHLTAPQINQLIALLADGTG